MTKLSDYLDLALVEELADDRYLERGRRYADEGRVRGLDGDDASLAATVRGTTDYEVRIWLAEGEVQYACDCPIGEEGAFCKHCVAVALTWLGPGLEESDGPGGSPRATAGEGVRYSGRSMKVTMKQVRTYLAGLEPAQLVSLLIDHAEHDDALRERLLLRTAAAASGTGDAAAADTAALRRLIDRTVPTGGDVPYQEAYGYTQRIHDVIDRVEEMGRAGHPVAVIELAEHALRRVEGMLESVDDSDGEMSGLLERLQEIHLEACQAARPEPEQLARRLFEWEFKDDWDVFAGAAERYARVLGDQGLSTYRHLAEAEWARVRPLLPGLPPGAAERGRRFRVTAMMEALARVAGDVDELIAVKSRDLSSAYGFLEIANVCRDAGRDDQAMDWAERGVRAFPERTDRRLREFLADRYQERGRHAEALELIWAEFIENPGLEGFRLLRRHAEAAGEWPAWRERALEATRTWVLRSKAIAHTQRSRAGRADPAELWRWARPADGTVLVQIRLSEGDPNGAWLDALELGCSDERWFDLARRRETDHPDDALPIYQRRVEALIQSGRNETYRAAVDLIGQVGSLFAQLSRDSDAHTYRNAVRATHARKRNFIRLLDELERTSSAPASHRRSRRSEP